VEVAAAAVEEVEEEGGGQAVEVQEDARIRRKSVTFSLNRIYFRSVTIIHFEMF
jgi:hypothetical protein